MTGRFRGDEREVLVNARFLAQTPTGVQRFALEMVRALAGLPEVSGDDDGSAVGGRHRLALLAPRGTDGSALGLRRIPLRRVGRLKGIAWGQLELPYYAGGGVLWSPANTGPLRHPRHVVTIHDASVLDHPEWFSSGFAAWYRFLLPRLARQAALITTVSEFSRERLAETLAVDPNRIAVVRAGVSPTFGPRGKEDVERTLSKLRLPGRYVLTLGSLEPRKNVARLLRAWDSLLVREAVPEDVHMIVVGGRSSLFRDIGLSRMPDRVVFAGYVADEDLPPLYSGALVFAYPSLYEGFGLPPLEAMACGAPVLTSRSTSIPEVTGEAALLVEPSETESIADGLRTLLEDDTLRKSLGVAGVERAGTFDWGEPARLLWRYLIGLADRC